MRVALKCWNLHVGRNVTGEAKKARDFIDEQENAADTPEAKKTAVIDSATTFIAALNAEIASLQAGIDAAPRIEKTDAAPAVPQQLPKESRDGQGQKAGLLGEAVAGEQVLPAVSKQLSVEFDGKSYPVESFEDASNKIRAAVDRGIRERAAGNKDVQVSLGNGFLPIRDASGKVIALVSENGRVWPTEKFKNGVSKSGIKALFDPFAGMSADQGAHPDNTTIDPTRSPIVAPQSDKSVSRTKNGKLEVSGFDREDVAESLKTAKIKATIAVGQDGKILVSMVGRDGNHMPMPAKQAKAIETALTGKSSKAPKARKFTGNLRNDVNIIAPGLYAEVSRGGDGEGLAGFDMSLIAEQLKAEGFMLPATETGKDSDAVIELIRQDIANGGGTLNEARTTAAMTEAEQKAHRQEVLRLADEYGVPAKDKGIWRKSEDVLADVENAIKHELGLAGSAVVEITKSGVAAGAFTSAEAKTLALGVAEAYRGDQGRDAKVRMYREIANLLQDKINERESEQNREVGRGSGEGRGTQGEAEAERPALELAGQSAEEIRAEEARIAAAKEAEEAEAREAEAKARKEKAEKDKADVQNRLANQPFEFGVGAKEAKQPQRDIFSASEPTEPIGKPSQGEANGKYQGPADVASRTGQMELADRAGVIASLKLMNDAIRKIDPTEAWHDANIEESRDLNALREQISNTLMRVQNAAKPADNADIRKSLDDMSGAELKAVFDEMNLAGRMMTVTERVDALMAEDPAEVRAAIAKVANSENQPAAPVPTSQGYTSADNANTDATLARTRDRSEVRFSTPYVGTTGAKLVGYVWPNKKEEYVDNRGEDRVRTVSDWEHAVENLETGRRIVHQFFIQKPDDTEQQVSAETAATLLGISEGAVRANARKLLEREIQREKARIAAIAGADKVDAIPAADSPAAAVDGGVVFEYALNAPMIQRMQAKGKNWQDIDDRIERESASRETYRFMERDGKYIWTPEIVSEGSELSRRGWKTVELRAMEIWPGSLTPKQLEMKARAEANKTPKQKEMKARAEAAKDLVSPIPGAPVPASIEALPAGMRAIYKVDELIEKAKSAWSNRRISDELNERGTADTPEAAMRELSNLRDIVAEQDGKLRSNNRTGATPGNLLTNWLELVRSINTINKSRREEPSMWSAYDERQKVVASMNIGDRVRDPYSSIEHPLGQPATIDRKFTKNWRVKFDDGSTALYHPSTLRPLEQGGSDGNLVSDNKQGAATLKKGDRFTDGQGKTWEVWNARTSLIEAFPVIDGNIRVNNQDGQRWATDERARFANPEARTDFTPLAKEKAPVTPQTLIGNPENYIKVAADSIKELRKIDVYRVLVESNRREFRQAIAAYIKENRPDLIDEVDSVMEEARAGEASSQAAPSPAAPSEKKTEDQTGGEAAVTEDAGEELKYNKRNRIVRLKWDDIKDQDAALKVKQVVKAKVLEKPDYQAMIDGGMQPLIAHIVKQVYDGLSAKPQTRTAPSDEQLQLYINGMNRVMNGAIAWAESQDSIEWLKKMGESASVQRAAMTGGRLDLSAMAGKKTEFKRLLDYIYPEGWKEYRPELMIVGGNRAVSAMQPGLDETIKALKEIEKGWPGTREAWQVQGYSIKQIIPQLIVTNYYEDKSRDGTPYVSVRMTVADGRQSLILYSDAIHGAEKKTDAAVQDVVSEVKDGVTGKHVLFDKGNRMVGAYGSLAAAQEAAREKVKRTGGGGIKEDGISVQAARRVGKARREDGENITSAKLMETFGFRGVNFGNWMKGKSNEAERQLHLNHAYDAFLDLAEILGVPPKAMSLNGMLGLAIGAQGNGTAAAHFVPGLNEINITRTSGAGAVAHEWGHALDHYFARKAGLEREAEPFLTEHANLPAAMHRIEIVDGARKSVSGPRFGDGLRPEVLDRFREIVSAMNKRELTQEEVAQRKKNNLESAVRNVERWLESIRRDYMAPHLQGKISGAEFDAIADRIKAMDLGSGEKVKLSKWNYISPVVAELRDLYKAKTGRSYEADNIKALQSWVDSVEYGTKSAQEDEDHKPQTTSTTYAANAAKLDHDKGGKKYWSTDLEKFARAFDAFVSDQLEERAARNTYLAGLNNDIETSPMGEERKATNAAFRALIETIETRETDTGIEFNSIEPRQTKAVDVNSPEFKRWFGDSKVVDAEGKPLVVYHGTDADITEFDPKKQRTGRWGKGFYFASSPERAKQYGKNVIPVYLRIKEDGVRNPNADGMIIGSNPSDRIYVVQDPTQIKSAISNTGAFDPSNPSILEDLSADQSAAITRAIDRAIAMEQGKDVAPLKRQRVRNRLGKLRADLEAGKITEPAFVAEVENLHAQMEIAYQSRQLEPRKGRERGADWIRQKLLEAKRRGDISEEAAKFAEWFVLKNPALVEDLGISLRSKQEGRASGNYNPANRVMTLFKGEASDTTTIHEILHHLERMMPADMQAEIRREWLKQSTKELAKAQKVGDQRRVDYFMAALAGDQKAATKILTSGNMDVGRDYRYLNASEFWAVSMTETVADRFKAKDSIWARSLQWLREALEHIKAVLGLNSRHPLIKALNDISKGTGEFVSKDMLGSSDLYASIEPIPAVIEEVVGPVLRDISLPARLLLHPRQVAANHKEFAPVFDTAIRQYEERDSIVSKLGDLAKAYFDLGNAKKVRVGQIIEQGRLDRMTYTREDLENGIHHHGGDLIRLDDSEVAAYFSLRNAFDEALTLFRNTMLEEYGFPELVGEERAALRLAQMIAGGEIEEKRLEWAKKVAVAINEIEQAKRTGYAPFTRYGQFVVAVKALPRGVDVVEDDDLVLVRGVPESAEEGTPEARLVEIVTDLSGQFDDARGAWIVPVSRNQAVRALEKTLYATKVEVGSIKEWRSRGQDVTEIPEVKAAFDAAKAKYGNVQNSRIIAFHISEKEKARDANITAIDELAKIAAVDTETWDEVRAKLQDAIKSRGFRRHFFGSDNTPGYSTDFERSIADYIIGMSGYLARRKHVKEFDDAITRIKAPKLAAYADEYRQYVNSPADEFALVKQIGFLSYIAGTVATAATNLTQVPMLTVPTLAQFVPHHVAVRETARAWKDALAMFSPTATGLQMFDPAKVPADVGEAFMAAWNDQLFVPLETLDLMATASVKTVGGRTTMRVLNQTTQAIAYLFMFAERINRITTFIAAQRISRMPVAKQNMQRVVAGDAWAKFSIGGRKWNERSFAEWVVDESQYRMGKVNRPKLSRGVGSPLLQFKGYMMQTLEAGYRMAAMHGPRGQASFLAAIAMMLMLGGLWGLPGLEDLRDIIEKFYKVATGKDLDLKTETRRIAAEMTGSATVGSAVAKGVPYATIGVDMSRVGMGNIIPDSPLQVFGIPADMAIGRPMRAAERAAAGNYYGAMTEMLPNFLKNPAVGLQWKFDGLRDRFGSRLMTPGEFDYGDVAIKSLGWTPTKVTNRRDYTYAESRAESGINELKRRYTNDLVRAYVREQQATTGAERKQYLEEQKAVLEAIAKHNAKASQEQMIKLDPDTLRKKAAAELLGGKAREGKERKFSRDAAQQRRELFQVP